MIKYLPRHISLNVGPRNLDFPDLLIEVSNHLKLPKSTAVTFLLREYKKTHLDSLLYPARSSNQTTAGDKK
jgi:hypothetical protein